MLFITVVRTYCVLYNNLNCHCSLKAHSSVERACLLGAVRCHKVLSDDKNSMSAEALRSAIEQDRREGLVPFLVRIIYIYIYIYVIIVLINLHLNVTCVHVY